MRWVLRRMRGADQKCCYICSIDAILPSLASFTIASVGVGHLHPSPQSSLAAAAVTLPQLYHRDKVLSDRTAGERRKGAPAPARVLPYPITSYTHTVHLYSLTAWRPVSAPLLVPPREPQSYLKARLRRAVYPYLSWTWLTFRISTATMVRVRREVILRKRVKVSITVKVSILGIRPSILGITTNRWQKTREGEGT